MINRVLPSLLVASIGCGVERDSAEVPPGSGVDLDDDDAGDDDTETAAAGSEDDPDEDLDAGAGTGPGANPDGTQGCDKVDFVFVVDNSGSMGDEQQNLLSSFPGFIDTIEATLADARDFHILVLDVDAWVYEACDLGCDPPAECIDPLFGCVPTTEACQIPCQAQIACAQEPAFTCGTTAPEACEDVLGAGIRRPRGQGSSNTECEIGAGRRFIDGNSDDVKTAFECAARVGTGSYGLTERPLEALVEAVSPGTDAAVCNDGFLRDDAILVVTFITDESDDAEDSRGDPASWRQALVDAKNGDPAAVVVLGLFGDNDTAGGLCAPLDPLTFAGAESAPRLREFVESWGDHGFIGSVCAPSYAGFFEQAVEVIDLTCEEFVPPEG